MDEKIKLEKLEKIMRKLSKGEQDFISSIIEAQVIKDLLEEIGEKFCYHSDIDGVTLKLNELQEFQDFKKKKIKTDKEKKLKKELKELLTDGWSEKERETWNEYARTEIKPFYPEVAKFLKEPGIAETTGKLEERK